MRLTIVFSFILLTVITGCNDPKLNPIPKDGRILAFGDSLTAGYGVSKNQSYPAVLAKLSGLDVINAGISGETTTEGLARFESELEETSPSFIILMEGGNDILRGMSLEQCKENLASMIQIAQMKKIPVLLIGIPEKKLFSNSAPLYQELADQFDLLFMDSIIGDLQRQPSLKSDYVHFNEEGYKKLAEEIFLELQNNGGL